MISDIEINKYLNSFRIRQDELSLYVIKLIAKRLNKMASLASFDEVYRLQNTVDITSDITSIRTKKKDVINKQLDYFEDMLFDIALIAYLDSQIYYYMRQLDFVEFQQNQELISDVYKTIELLSKNFSDIITNPLMYHTEWGSPENVYRQFVSDFSYRQQLDINKDNFKSSVLRLYKRSMMFMNFDTNTKSSTLVSANNAIKSYVLDSIKQMLNVVQKVIAKQINSDGIELSAHVMSAPDHEPVQGRQFSNENFERMQAGEDFEDANGNAYSGFPRPIGFWNCKHYAKSIVLGAPPEYTEKELQDMRNKNKSGYVDKNGKHYTLYECTQVQRRYEQHIRENRDLYLICKTLGLKDDATMYRTKAEEYLRAYALFSNSCDIPIEVNNIKVQGYQ